MSPSTVISTRRRQLADERAEQPAEPLGERQERAQRLVGLGGDEVDGERHELAGQGELHHVGDRVAGLVLRLAGAGAEVRRDDDRRRARTAATRSSARCRTRRARRRRSTPSRMASASAASSTMPPRATLITRSVGLALSSRSRPIRPVVSGVFGRWMVRKSDSATTWSSGSSSTPSWRAALGRHERVVGDEAHAEARGPGRRRACRCGRGRRCRASCRPARRPPTGCAPSARRRARRGPGARCGPGRAAAPSCARRPTRCCSAGR